MATEERREYESTWGPSRSAGDAWCEECGVGPVGVPGTCRESDCPGPRWVSNALGPGLAVPAGPM